MKNLFVLSVLSLVIFFSSCKKDGNKDDNASGTMTAQIDGVATVFNVSAKATRLDVFQQYSISINGFQGTPGSSDQMAIAITGTQKIITGTYSENGSGSFTTAFNHKKSSNTYPYISNGSASNPAIITITAVSATSVQGTFSGDIYLMDQNGPTATKKVLSRGQFNVNF